MENITTHLVGQVVNSKDLHAMPQDIEKSLLTGDDAIKAGMVISIFDGKATKYNGIPFALVTNNTKPINLNYSDDI